MPFLPPNCSGIQELGWPPPLQPLKIQHRCQANMVDIIEMLVYIKQEKLAEK